MVVGKQYHTKHRSKRIHQQQRWRVRAGKKLSKVRNTHQPPHTHTRTHRCTTNEKRAVEKHAAAVCFVCMRRLCGIDNKKGKSGGGEGRGAWKGSHTACVWKIARNRRVGRLYCGWQGEGIGQGGLLMKRKRRKKKRENTTSAAAVSVRVRSQQSSSSSMRRERARASHSRTGDKQGRTRERARERAPRRSEALHETNKSNKSQQQQRSS